MKSISQYIFRLCTCLFAASGVSAMPVIIDFEDVAVASGSSVSQGADFVSGGFRFSTSLAGTSFESSGLSLQNDYADPFFLNEEVQSPHSGNTNLSGLTSIKEPGYFGRGYVNIVTMESADGLSFSLMGLEAAENFVSFTSGLHRHLRFVGTTTGGEQLSQSIQLDGVFDGAGPENDFEFITFGADWINLASLSFSSGDFANLWNIDNINLMTEERNAGSVPSVGTLSLLAMGLMLLALNRNLIRRHSVNR